MKIKNWESPSKSTRKKGSPFNAAINNHFGILKSPSMKEKKQDRPFLSKVNNKHSKKKKSTRVPTIIPLSLSDKTIKERTGFVSDIVLINFIIVVCNGDFDVIKSTQSKLTWYEEWFFILKLFGEGVIHDGMVSWQNDLGW